VSKRGIQIKVRGRPITCCGGSAPDWEERKNRRVGKKKRKKKKKRNGPISNFPERNSRDGKKGVGDQSRRKINHSDL